VHWCDPATVAERATAAATAVLTEVAAGVTTYRESPLAPE